MNEIVVFGEKLKKKKKKVSLGGGRGSKRVSAICRNGVGVEIEIKKTLN